MVPLITEISLVILASIMTAAFCLVRKFGMRTALLCSMAALPLIALSVESMNSMLTCDESYAVYESANLAADSLLQWSSGSSRTTDLAVGVPLLFVKKITGWSLDIMGVQAKSLHWLWGFVFILLLADAMRKLHFFHERNALSFVVSLYAIMTLPVVAMAVKIINYDSLSMLPGALAILWLALGLREKKRRYLLGAVAMAAVGAQEKLIAAPLIWVALFTVSIAGEIAARNSLKARLFSIVKSSARATGFALGVMLATFLIVGIARGGNFPDPTVNNVFYPFFAFAWPLLWYIGVDSGAVLRANFSIVNPLYLLLFWTILQTAVIALSMGLQSVVRALQNRSAEKWFAFVNGLITLAAIVTGIIATFGLKACIAPIIPFARGEYAPTLSFNALVLHFGAPSPLTHGLLSASWGYATLVNALPTLFLALAGATAIVDIVKPKARISRSSLIELSYTGALVAPFLFGMLQIPIGNRYFNLFILIAILRWSGDFLRLLPRIPIRKAAIASAACCAVLVAEALPFRPLYGAFRPLWSNYSAAYNKNPSRGIVNPSWMGWGEEVMLAGKKIRNMMKAQGNGTLDDVRIYHNYFGEWLFRKNKASLLLMDTLESKDYRYSGNDFYILNRMAISISELPFPETTTPVFSVSYRGFTEAWVFRGSDLAKNNFHFPIADNPEKKPWLAPRAYGRKE
jgi:hypothetical protein